MVHKKRIKQLGISLGIIVVLIALVFLVIRPSKDVVATVNGEKITVDEFKMLYDKVVTLSPDLPKDKILDQLISNKALVQEAKKQGIVVENTEVDGVITLTESLYQAKIADLLVNSSISMEVFKSKIKEQLMMQKLFNKTIKVEDSTDEELRKFYANNSQMFSVPESVNVSHILSKTESEAEDIKSDLESGADFYELAAEKSIDPSAKMNSGNLGPIQKGMTVPEFEAVAFSLGPGKLSDPVKSDYGYHIIMVEGRLPAKKLTYGEVKDQLKMMANQQKQQDEIVKYVDSLVKKANVKKYLENL